MCREVAGAEISFHFNDPAGGRSVDQHFAKAIARNLRSRPREKLLFEHVGAGRELRYRYLAHRPLAYLIPKALALRSNLRHNQTQGDINAYGKGTGS